MTAPDPCFTLLRPVAVGVREAGRLWYRCTGCGARWPLGSGYLAHPRHPTPEPDTKPMSQTVSQTP